MEKAYCAIILPEFALDYCPVCFRRIYDESNGQFDKQLNVEPCNKCTSVLYCSQACQSQAIEDCSFHRFECGVQKTLLHNLGIAHLAYRIVASTKWDVLRAFAQYEIDNTMSTTDLMKIDYRKSDHRDCDYKQVFNLMTHEQNTHVDDLFKYTMTSLLLGKLYLAVCLLDVLDKK